MIRVHVILIVMALFLAAGCAPRSQRAETIPVMTAPPMEEAEADPTANPGSLYDPGSSEHLFSDNRARRVGDIVVINIVEVSSGEHTANTDTERDASTDIKVTNFFNKKSIGIDPIGGTGLLGLSGNIGQEAIVGSKTYNKMKGKASTDRDSTVKATVAARVVNILPGGLMQVEGAREVRVNEETQILVIRGLVRPRDIGPDNTVSSSHLANSSIEYYGKGVLADKQKAGWVTRLLDNVWPF